jgi:hypothetical protein
MVLNYYVLAMNNKNPPPTYAFFFLSFVTYIVFLSLD